MNKLTVKTFFFGVLKRFATIFSLTVIAMSAAGIWIDRYNADLREVSALFALSGGLPYGAVLQITVFSLIISVFSELLFSELFQTKIHFFIRGLLLLLATLFVTSIFILLFRWIPREDPLAWTGFILCTVSCFTASFALMLLMLKLEGKKYDKLLADFKARQTPSG